MGRMTQAFHGTRVVAGVTRAGDLPLMSSSLARPRPATETSPAFMLRLAGLLGVVVGGGCPSADSGRDPAGPAVAPGCPVRTLGPPSSTAERGVLVVLAGEGSAGFVDGVAPRFDGVGGLAFAADRLIVTDIFNATVRAVDPATAQSETLWGSPLQEGAVDGVCSDVRCNGPRGVAVDPADAGILWFGDGPCLRRGRLAQGDVVTIAGDCQTPGFVDGTLADARFGFLLHDVEAAMGGRVFLADRVNDSIRAVDVENGTVTTLASGLDGPGALALDEPAGHLYVADTFACVIRRIDLTSQESLIVAGQPGTCGAVDGSALQARLDTPQGLAIVGDRLLVGGFSGDVRSVDLFSGAVATVASVPAGFFAPFVTRGERVFAATNDGAIVSIAVDGNVAFVAGPREPFGFVDGDGVDARFALPVSVVGLPGGREVLVSDAANHALRVVAIETGVTTTLLGGPARAGHVDGNFDEARLDYPAGLALTADGTTLWVADNGDGSVVRVDLAARTVTTVARIRDAWDVALDEAAGALWVVASGPGELVRVGTADGVVEVLTAALAYPVGVAVADDAVWVAENEGHVLSRVDAAGTISVALGVRGFEGVVAGDADVALLSGPSGVFAVDDERGPALYVAETGGQVVRRVDRRDLSSRIVVGQTTTSGALPAGSRVSLADGTLLNPLDVVAVAGDLVVVGDATVVVARP
jgi:sugar lactone lactonase YvrE